MPVKRTLRLEEKENITPSKKPALDRTYSPLTGTCSIHHTHTPPADLNLRENAGSPTVQEPQTDKEKFHALRSKIEASVNAFLKARQQIEKTLSTEGGSELSGFFRGGSSDLQAELCKYRELCALVEARLDGIDLDRHRRDERQARLVRMRHLDELRFRAFPHANNVLSQAAIKLLRIPKINPELRSNSASSDQHLCDPQGTEGSPSSSIQLATAPLLQKPPGPFPEQLCNTQDHPQPCSGSSGPQAMSPPPHPDSTISS